ncbi:MAG: hypothetical protein AB7O24_09600 [Kofleriaceae bacterium]
MSGISCVVLIAAVLLACKDHAAKAPPVATATTGSGAAGAADDTGSTTGTDSPESAVRGLFEALAKGDTRLASRFLPDLPACRAVRQLKECKAFAEDVRTNGADVGPRYAGGTLTRSSTAGGIPSGELWLVNAPNRPPLKLVAFKVGNRFYAVALLREHRGVAAGSGSAGAGSAGADSAARSAGAGSAGAGSAGAGSAR